VLALAKSAARRVGLRREHVAAVRMRIERHALARLARPVERTTGRILCYHSIDQAFTGVNDVAGDRFRGQIENALGQGYRFVPASRIAVGGGSAKDLAITFDDGWSSVATRAAEILGRFGIPWTLFVVTEWSSHSDEWARNRIVSWDAIERLVSQGVEIGSHSRTHPDFGRITRSQMADELAGSRAEIERRLGFRPSSFAIPLGQSMNWPAVATEIARDVGFEIVYAQAEETRPPNTTPRTFVTRFDSDRIFSALLRGAYDTWEEWA